mmetsp:Transcript_9291/g.20093  ORF Transcript_9291/g.20093 Transcript_9291/m.20093 type:complete len:668 (-) Transcript_9291:4-2007(-)
MASYLLPLTVSATTSLLADAMSFEKENQVKMILQDMEASVLAFRDELERLAASRCDTATLLQCSNNNYNDCSSTYPNQQCMAADELVVSACGDGETCNAIWDKTKTAVRIPAALAQGSHGNPTDPRVIESICYSRLAEKYMVENYNPGHQMYFGSSRGSFRIIPARHSETCGLYDCRRRPWFVAASSGPKDVVLVIDVSESMNDYARMYTAKEAAITVVDTLTVADRFAIITFSNEATQIGGQGGLIRATNENKKRMIEEIKGLEAKGTTNFYAAFDAAFDALDRTIKDEATSGCNAAVLFMTDGQITEGPGETQVINLVNNRTAEIATNFKQKTTIFTFSLGKSADHKVTKRIACSTNGIWTKVDDYSDDLVTEMSSYYKLYALGLGEGGNEDWVAWVEPYRFHTAGKMGTSASAPVYDRSVYPPQLMGVATVDMWMDDLEEIVGEDATSSAMLERFIALSTARCPAIELNECEIDALRFLGGGEEATCGACNATETEFEGILPNKCRFESDLPNDCWQNTDMEGKIYPDRACCERGGDKPSNVCPAINASSENADTATIIGVVIAVVALSGLLICLWKRKLIQAKMQRTPSNTDAETDDASNWPPAGGPEVGVEVTELSPTGEAEEAVGPEEIVRRLSSSINHEVPPVEVAPSAPPFNPEFTEGE